MDETELTALVAELTALHGCHTFILYGSRAHGTETPASDIDIMGFRAGDEAISDCRRWRDYWLDAWIKPEAEAQKPEDFLHLDGARVLVQQEDFGERLIEAVGLVLARPMPPVAADVIQHRKAWLSKTLARIRRGDPEGWNRRHWLLAQLIEEHFLFQGQYFLGFKRSMQTLAARDPELHGLFLRLYSEAAELGLIETIVGAVLERAERANES